MRYLFHNSFDAPFELALEPWAETATIEPGVDVIFDISGDNALVEFVPDGAGALLYLWGDHIEMRNGDDVRTWEPPPRFRGGPPPGAKDRK